MNIEEYILINYQSNQSHWFEDEVNSVSHKQRILKVVEYKEYLHRKHKILQKPDIQWKGSEYKTKKLILQTLKSILRFHTSFVVGNSINFKGTDKMVKAFSKVYREGAFSNVDYKVVDNVNKYGDSYEYIYVDNINSEKIIKSKIIASEDGYPVYDEDNQYIAFIEHWINNTSKIYHYYVYYPDRVEYWNNEGRTLTLIETKPNISSLPIHRHNMSNWDDIWGESLLEDLMPLMDTLEDFLSKFDDSIYTMSLNPIPTENGGREPDINDEGAVNPDGTGYIMHLAQGAEFKINSTMLDSASIKLYLDTINQQLIEIGCMPSVSMGQSNIANISQEVIEVVYQNADNFAKENSCWILEGINKRFEVITNILTKYFGLQLSEDDYIDASLNFNKIVNTKELMDNLNTQRDMGAISLRDVAEISPYTSNVEQTFKRIAQEKAEAQQSNIIDDTVNNNNSDNQNSNNSNQNIDNTKDKRSDKVNNEK